MKASCQLTLSHPDYLLSSVDAQHCRFAVINEQTYRQSAFLDHRMQPLPQQAVRMATAALLQVPADAANRPAELIIAHSSFCASTLLARMLDAQDVLVLREPQVLGQLANLRRTDDGSQRLVDAAIWQLYKRFHAQQKLVIKLSNYANNLLPDMLRLGTQSRLLIMLGSLEELLVSMHLHAEEGAHSLPRFLQAMQLDLPETTTFSNGCGELDLLQQTAMLWHLQLRQFNTLLGQYHANIRVLLTEQFMAAPDQTITAIDQWIEADRDNAQRERVIAAMMNIDAKSRGGEASVARSNTRRALRESLRGEIDATRRWAIDHGLHTHHTELHNIRYLLE